MHQARIDEIIQGFMDLPATDKEYVALRLLRNNWLRREEKRSDLSRTFSNNDVLMPNDDLF